MYVVNRKTKKLKKWPRRLIVAVILIAVAFGLWWFFTRSNFKTSGSATSLRPTNFQDGPKIHITEPLYGFNLPADWKELNRSNNPYKMVTWKGTARESDARTIDVYVDVIPQTIAVNRIVPVSGQDDRLGVSSTSDNCIQFTGNAANLTSYEATKLRATMTEWQGVKFLCDIPNSLRNVASASSSEGLNQVTLTGQKGGKHRYYFVYTDHTAHPDAKTFTEMLNSFRAL